MITLLPQPKKIQEKEGSYTISYDKKIVLSADSTRQDFFYATLLKDTITKWAGSNIPILQGMEKQGDIFLTKQEQSHPESYHLSIRSDGITISGQNTGLLYGIQTLRQIITQFGAVLPEVEIEDMPDFSHRGFYHDVTRGRVPTLDYLKKLADRMSYYKLNELQLYIEHTYLFRDLSEVWRDETPLTAEEILELDAYCAQRGIELVPSLASFGHLYQLLSTKTYAHLCELEDSETKPFSFLARMQHHTMNISDPDSLKLSKALITEYMSLFQSTHFNICADETFDLGKGKSKHLAEQKGTNQMYLSFVKELCEYLVSKGKQPMFWGDIICGFPESLSELPKETICLSWGYLPNQRDEETKRLAKAGAVQYVCPGVAGWNKLVNNIFSSYQNIKIMCEHGKKYNAVGVLNTDWGDFGHVNHPEFSAPGMIYGACFSWNGEEISYDELNCKISELEYHDTSKQIVSLLGQVEGTDRFNWETMIRFAEKWRDGIPKEKQHEVAQSLEISEKDQANEKLKEVYTKLLGCVSYMDSSSRELISAACLAIDGICLLNCIGSAVKERLLGREKQTEDIELAEKLEKWFYQYKILWRTVSKEGDLVRIAPLIFWYADFLRERYPKKFE